MMAPYTPTDKASTAGDLEALASAHHSLQVVNELLQDTDRNICRLMATKIIRFPPQSESSDRLLEYVRDGFGGHDIIEQEWWKWATRNCLLESMGNLDYELEETRTSKTKFEDIQSTLRCCINKLSRPYVRDLTILDLPDEILLMIFERVENFNLDPPFPYYCDGGRGDIKNTRLVCRRFCNVSSPLLLRLVRVSLNEPSLVRLEEISRHPTIAKGVRVVQITLHFYNISFTDFDRYIRYLVESLESQVDLFEQARMWELLGTPEKTASKMIANGRAVILALRRLVSTYPEHGEHHEEDEDHRARLNEAHSKYLVLLKEQQSLIRTGRFSRAVGSAIARMPSARKLDFNDTDFEYLKGQQLMSPGGDVWSALHRFMLQPITGYHVKTHGLDPPNYQCIVNTIEAVRSAGASLDHINIKLVTLEHASLAPSPDIRREFSSGMQQLVGFEFSCTGYPSEQGVVDDLHGFLSACLNTSSLQELYLDMRSEEVEGAEPGRINVGQIMGSRSRDKLTDIFFGQVAMDFSGMVRFLDQLPQSMRCMHQEDVRLVGGTWEAALDTLRSKKHRVVILSEPRGAECDDMPREDYERIFCEKDHRRCSEAESYIANRMPQQCNPLRALRDGIIE